MTSAQLVVDTVDSLQAVHLGSSLLRTEGGCLSSLLGSFHTRGIIHRHARLCLSSATNTVAQTFASATLNGLQKWKTSVTVLQHLPKARYMCPLCCTQHAVSPFQLSFICKKQQHARTTAMQSCRMASKGCYSQKLAVIQTRELEWFLVYAIPCIQT